MATRTLVVVLLGIGALAGLAIAVIDAARSPSLRPARDAPAEAAPDAAVLLAAPAVPDGPVDDALLTDLRALGAMATAQSLDEEVVDRVVAAGDPRAAWYLADLLRFAPDSFARRTLVDAFDALTGADTAGAGEGGVWVTVTNQLMAWDLPVWDTYPQLKADLFLQIEPAWEQFFADADAEIDWRVVSWGGVLIDDRPLGDTQGCPRSCIPALDDPALTPAEEGDWYADDRIVFGVVVDDEAVAFPRHQMEIHEMVNITIAERRLGIPYCTLCGSAQAYLTDTLPAGFDAAVLRTSGLLSRSNKVMYDLRTGSVFDTFTGRAVSGPLREAGVELEQVTVITTTWGQWKRTHPQTQIVARDGGILRSYSDNPLRGRDDDGPIFPIGLVDDRLPVQEAVVGVIAPDGQPVAFPVALATAALAEGRTVEVAGVTAVAEAGGLRALAGGDELPAHQAFWFAWSQFHPDTLLWSPLGG
jgi:hypothetical protein